MAYPSVVTSFTNPNASDRLNSPSHSAIETAQNTGLTELQTFVGTLSSTAGTLMYDVRSPQSDGGGHIQSANKGGTGQTTYNKGDLLVATSTSVLSKLAVGSDGAFLVADSAQATGLKWGGSTDIQTFSVAGTWVKPANAKIMYVTAIGAGAPGGDSGAGNPPGGGGGGGGGAIDSRVYPAAIFPTSVAVTMGDGTKSSVTTYFGTYFSVAGGIAGSVLAGGSGSAGDGGPGGATGISGGRGGAGGTAGTGTGGGGGGAGGANGTAGASGGFGGLAGTSYTYLGIGGNGGLFSSVGSRGSVYGAGGGGGGGDVNINRAGANGSPGFIQVITLL